MAELSLSAEKQVISRADGAIVGVLDNVYFDADAKKLEYISARNASTNSTLLIPFADVVAISDAAIVQDTLNARAIQDVDVTVLQSDMLGKYIYAQNGANKGRLQKVYYSKTGKVTKFCTDDKELLPSSFATIGDVILLKSDAPIKQRKVALPRPEEDAPVAILSQRSDISDEVQSNTAPIPAPPIPIAVQLATQVQPARPIALSADEREPVFSRGAFEKLVGKDAKAYRDEDAHTPTRIICDYDFLLNRVLVSDLNTYSGERIAKKGTPITVDIVEKARYSGKLVELTLNSIQRAND